MAKRPPRDFLAIMFKDFINSLKPRKFTGELKGTDQYGNKYFEIPAGGNRSKRARYFEPIEKEDGFDKELPAEWESWLRGRRHEPPSEEEVMRNYQLMLDKKKKALEIEEKFKSLKKDKLAISEEETKKVGAFPEYDDYEKVSDKVNSSTKR